MSLHRSRYYTPQFADTLRAISQISFLQRKATGWTFCISLVCRTHLAPKATTPDDKRKGSVTGRASVMRLMLDITNSRAMQGLWAAGCRAKELETDGTGSRPWGQKRNSPDLPLVEKIKAANNPFIISQKRNSFRITGSCFVLDDRFRWKPWIGNR